MRCISLLFRILFLSFSLIGTSVLFADHHLEKININVASATMLAKQLKGVGQSKAEAIVKYRQMNGMFKKPEDIKKVKGISKSIWQKNMKIIMVSSKKMKPEVIKPDM